MPAALQAKHEPVLQELFACAVSGPGKVRRAIARQVRAPKLLLLLLIRSSCLLCRFLSSSSHL